MTSFEWISIIVSVAGSLAVIVTLWFAYRQTRIFSRQTEYVARSLATSLSQTINGQVADLTRLFITYPDMRPYFYKGQPIAENHANYARAEAMAELFLDTLYTIADEVRRSGAKRSDERGREFWETYVSDCFAQSPILVKFLTERQAWYSDELVELMQRGVKARQSQLSGQAPPP